MSTLNTLPISAMTLSVRKDS